MMIVFRVFMTFHVMQMILCVCLCEFFMMISMIYFF